MPNRWVKIATLIIFNHKHTLKFNKDVTGRWISANKEDRIEHLHQLLSNTRLGLLEPEYFMSKVKGGWDAVTETVCRSALFAFCSQWFGFGEDVRLSHTFKSCHATGLRLVFAWEWQSRVFEHTEQIDETPTSERGRYCSEMHGDHLIRGRYTEGCLGLQYFFIDILYSITPSIVVICMIFSVYYVTLYMTSNYAHTDYDARYKVTY